MFRWLFKRLIKDKPTSRPVALPYPRRVILTAACRAALRDALAPEIMQQHEGIVYLLGQTDGRSSLIVAISRPRATTSPGSFHVGETAMRSIVEIANAAWLQIVGQLHTHPRAAYHSDGDEHGASIRYPGFVSIVLSDYGTRLPSLDGAAVYMYSADDHRFIQLRQADLSVLSVCLP